MDMYSVLREERRREWREAAEQERRLMGLSRGRQPKYPRNAAKREQTQSLRHPFARRRA